MGETQFPSVKDRSHSVVVKPRGTAVVRFGGRWKGLALPGYLPSQIPSRIPGEMPSQIPSQIPGEMLTQVPSQIPGGMHTQVPSQIPGGMPPEMQGETHGQTPPQRPLDVKSVTYAISI